MGKQRNSPFPRKTTAGPAGTRFNTATDSNRI